MFLRWGLAGRYARKQLGERRALARWCFVSQFEQGSERRAKTNQSTPSSRWGLAESLDFVNDSLLRCRLPCVRQQVIPVEAHHFVPHCDEVADEGRFGVAAGVEF